MKTTKILMLLFLVQVSSLISVSGDNESYVRLDFNDSDGEISKSISIPSKNVISYELDSSQNIYSVGFFSEPNHISLPRKHANTYYVFSRLNPKPSIVEKNNVAYFQFICLNGPFYLICDLSEEKLYLMLADTKCMEIEIQELVLPENAIALFFLEANPGSYSDVDAIALNLPPLIFDYYISENAFRRISIFPETIQKDSLMEKLYSSVTRNIVVSNEDYKILASLLFEKRSFLAWKSNPKQETCVNEN